MKSLFLLPAILAGMGAASADTLRGTVQSETGQPVEFATVVALSDSIQCGVAVADSLGRYYIDLPAGRYAVEASFVGFGTATAEAHVEGDTRLNLTLGGGSVEMRGVEVRASAIRREADRFVMTVSEMPSALGQNSKELLRQAPGVWIDDNGISIYGKSGVKVYVDERELNLDTDQMMAFLASLRAEDISKVEILPHTGADYSADTAAGVIRITMKRSRADGVRGSVSLSADAGRDKAGIVPGLSLNVKKGAWAFNASGSLYANPKGRMGKTERTDYSDGSSYAAATEGDWGKTLTGYASVGAFFDPNPKNSFGLELSYNRYKRPQLTLSSGEFFRAAGTEQTDGNYASRTRGGYFDATFNYLHRLDSLGSSMKAIVSFNTASSAQRAYNSTATALLDSLSRSKETTRYDVVNASYDFNKTFNRKFSASAGAKLTVNKMHNAAWYRHLAGDDWLALPGRDYDERFTERIYAAYLKASALLGGWSLTAGVRAELTDADSRTSAVAQSYTDFFPSASLTYRFSPNGSELITADYSRHVSRPSFWLLNPTRQQLSDYLFQAGNPDLRSAYEHAVSVTGVMKHKYSLTLWLSVEDGQMMSGTLIDGDNPENVVWSTVNADRGCDYGASLSLPLNLTSWWTATANINFMRTGSRLSPDAPLTFNNMLNASIYTGFQLPRNFYFDISYFAQTRAVAGEIEIGAYHSLNASLKKTFADKRWTLTAGVGNILLQGLKVKIANASYVNRIDVDVAPTVNFSVAYNFSVGTVADKRIEKNNDASRTVAPSAF